MALVETANQLLRRHAPPDEMANVNERKRAAHRRRGQAALHQILNAPAVLPEAGRFHLVRLVSRVRCGRFTSTCRVNGACRVTNGRRIRTTSTCERLRPTARRRSPI